MADEQPIVLRAEDAQITTATITIKTIRVGKRQLTQSVFRQLPRVDLLDEQTAKLNGDVWGWVNYYWGQEQGGTHFVLQHGQNLYRALFQIRSSSQLVAEWRPRSYVGGRLDEVETHIQAIALKKYLEAGAFVETERYDIDWLGFRPKLPLLRNVGEPLRDGDAARIQQNLQSMKLADATVKELQTRVTEMLGTAIFYCRRWDQAMKKLEDTEQLFIAC